jgi:hypothetical protein
MYICREIASGTSDAISATILAWALVLVKNEIIAPISGMAIIKDM